MRRSRWLLLLLVLAALAGAAAAGPTTYRRGRVAWRARGLESADEATRWSARRALLELPRGEVAHVFPRVCAGAILDIAAEASSADVAVIQSRGEQTGWFGGMSSSTELFTSAVDEVLRGKPRRTAELAVGDGPSGNDAMLVRRYLWHDVEPNGARAIVILRGAVLDAEAVAFIVPLDADGETLRLVREALPR